MMAGTVSLKLDVYQPKAPSSSPRPCIVWIHGGGWTGGSRFPPGPSLQLLTRGIAVASVTYRLTRRDRALLGRGLARLALLMLEAGATAVYPSYRGAPLVRRLADLATLQATFAVSRASVMTVHLCSTVPFGEDERSATDSFGLVRGTTNVRVNDASLLPDAPGVNPQASVMAVAIRNARRFIETVKV